MLAENFLTELDGKLAKRGFVQIFYLEAESPQQAELLAVEKIRGDEDLKRITQNSEDDPPSIQLDEIEEVESFDEDNPTETGKIWFNEKRWWQFWK